MYQNQHFKCFSVQWTHLPSGRTGVNRDAYFRSRHDFEQAVVYWNRIGSGTWRYEPQPGEGVPLPAHISGQLHVAYDGPVERAYFDSYLPFKL